MKNLPELLISGITLYFLGKEAVDSSTASSKWKDHYAAKVAELAELKAEILTARQAVCELHNSTMDLLGQVQEQEKELIAASRSYSKLVDQIESFGFRVSEDNEILCQSDQVDSLLEEGEDE